MTELVDAAARTRELLHDPGWISARRVREVHAGRARDEQRLEVVLRHDGRLGRAQVPGLGGEAARQAVARARSDAERSEADESPGPAAPSPGRPHEGFDAATARAESSDLAALLGDHPGEIRARMEWVALASSAGGEVLRDARSAVMVRVERGDGWARGAAVGLDGLDIPALDAVARWRAASGGEPGASSGELRAVLAPEAVGDLLAHLGATVFSGGHDPRLRLGTRVAAATVNLSDSPRFPGTLATAFDAEGTPKAPLPLVQDGVAHRVVHDGRTAARAGAASTGHARSAGGLPLGPAPGNLVLVGGGAADETALVAEVEQGVFVTALGDEGELLGAHEIREGQLSAPLRAARLEDDALDLLTRVEALSARPRLVGVGVRGVMAPAITLRGIMVA